MNEQDQRVRDYYNNLSLPQDKLEQLLKIEPAMDSSEKNSPTKNSDVEQHGLEPNARKPVPHGRLLYRFNPIHWHWHRWLPAGLACTFVLAASLWIQHSSTDSERMQRTVREVAMNHTTRLDPEYRGDTLAMLDNSMQQLPFNLVLPEAIDDAYKLIGSRYCSIGGVLAAHVRLRSSDTGKPISLFVTSNSAELEDIRSEQTTLEGIDVEFWREGGLFFALAQRS